MTMAREQEQQRRATVSVEEKRCEQIFLPTIVLPSEATIDVAVGNANREGAIFLFE
jgi:hypothetical protein